MRQITKRQLDRQGNTANLIAWLPFELVFDGEVVAVVTAPDDGSQAIDDVPKAKRIGSQARTKISHDIPFNGRFSKSTQASGRMRS